jgi:hypothetical protein
MVALVAAAAVWLPVVATIAANELDVCTVMAAEGWDSGVVAGWVGTAGTMVTVELVGGNPDGYLRGDNNGLVGAQTSDPPWIGDYATTGITDITVDLKYLTSNLQQPFLRLRKDGTSTGWYFVLEPVGTNDGLWHSYHVPVNPWWSDAQAQAMGWVVPGAIDVSFRDTLASVGIVVIGANSDATVHGLGIDNLTLHSCLVFADGFESGDTTEWSVTIP